MGGTLDFFQNALLQKYQKESVLPQVINANNPLEKTYSLNPTTEEVQTTTHQDKGKKRNKGLAPNTAMSGEGENPWKNLSSLSLYS